MARPHSRAASSQLFWAAARSASSPAIADGSPSRSRPARYARRAPLPSRWAMSVLPHSRYGASLPGSTLAHRLATAATLSGRLAAAHPRIATE